MMKQLVFVISTTQRVLINAEGNVSRNLAKDPT